MNANRVPLYELGVFALVATALAIDPRGQDARERGYAAANPKPAAAAPPRRGLLDRLDQWFWRLQQREVEAYLGQAKDVYDLEARIRDLERGAPHPYY